VLKVYEDVVHKGQKDIRIYQSTRVQYLFMVCYFFYLYLYQTLLWEQPLTYCVIIWHFEGQENQKVHFSVSDLRFCY